MFVPLFFYLVPGMRFPKVFFIFFTCAVLVIFTGCDAGKKKALIGEWYINPYHEQFLLEAANEHAVLRLYPKGVFTQYGDSGYCTGTWKRNPKGNYLHLTRKSGTLPMTEEFLKIEMLQSDEMTAGVFFDPSFRIADKQMVIQLKRRTNTSDEDPYAPELQTWRMKPEKPESEMAIRKRVEGYLHFLHSMYKHAVDNKTEIINNWYPSPLRMDYGGGVRMAYSNEIAT